MDFQKMERDRWRLKKVEEDKTGENVKKKLG